MPQRLNQISSRQIPDQVWLTGTAHSDAAIFLNGQVASRKDNFWAASAHADNSATAQTLDLTVESLYLTSGATSEVLQSTQSAGQAHFPQTPLTPTYDDDGNLLNDGRWAYTWNGENRLITMQTLATAYNAGAPREKLDFIYDYQGRRVSKTLSTWDTATSSWQVTAGNRYIYDGWNLIAELDTQTTPITLKNTHLWGTDLSGSQQGAGGVAGLLTTTDTSNSTNFPHYDGNGNVMGYYAATDGSNQATYEYGPFGELIRSTGPKKDEFNFRFSTKYEDAETGLLYYGFRYYDPVTGRWLSRDPIEENGGLNLYGIVGNDPLNYIDLLGLSERRIAYFGGVKFFVYGDNINDVGFALLEIQANPEGQKLLQGIANRFAAINADRPPTLSNYFEDNAPVKPNKSGQIIKNGTVIKGDKAIRDNFPTIADKHKALVDAYDSRRNILHKDKVVIKNELGLDYNSIGFVYRERKRVSGIAHPEFEGIEFSSDTVLKMKYLIKGTKSDYCPFTNAQALFHELVHYYDYLGDDVNRRNVHSVLEQDRPKWEKRAVEWTNKFRSTSDPKAPLRDVVNYKSVK